MRKVCVIICLIHSVFSYSQYKFSGYVDTVEYRNTVYLSIVDDYRKINGMYSEQIIAKATADSSGYFEFTGNMLDKINHIYRIHVDKCSKTDQDVTYFDGFCRDTKTLTFIANNNDNLQLPFSFENQVFCNIVSTNPKANAFVKIDSLKSDMRFAYGEFRSEANRKLNNKKWFKNLQEFGTSLNEPLAELYIYAYLSDRTSDLHNYYVKDLKSNSYYSDLKDRLNKTYPNASYTKQYNDELASDQYMIGISEDTVSGFNWTYLVLPMLLLSVGINLFFLFKKKEKTSIVSQTQLREKLSKQERVVLDLILENKTNKDIADTLFLSVSTVKTHTNSIYKKLKVSSREEAKSLFIN